MQLQEMDVIAVPLSYLTNAMKVTHLTLMSAKKSVETD